MEDMARDIGLRRLRGNDARASSETSAPGIVRKSRNRCPRLAFDIIEIINSVEGDW